MAFPPCSLVGFLIAFLVQVCWTKVDFCADNRLPLSNWSSRLQFTKELSDWEYAVHSKFKSLHCCAKGYRSIEWYKDGRPYPWPGDASTFILYPESANQTIYSQHLKPSDAGNYTCRIHNDTLQMQHNTQLTVFDTPGYMEKPLATYKPAAISNAFLGEQARLFCEAFVGHISLPDASSEVFWTKMGNESFMDSRMHLEHVQREGGQIVGAYLMIEDVQVSDLGTYMCTISNTGDQKIVMSTRLEVWSDPSPQLCLWGGLMTILFCATLTTIALILVIYTFKLIRKENYVSSILGKLLEKSRFANSTPKKLGLVLLYGEEDTEIVETLVVPELREKCGYNVFPQKLTVEGTVSDESKELINRVGRIMIILTEKVIKEWTEFNMIAALQKIIPPQQHCILNAEPLPGHLGSLQQHQRNNFDFEKNIDRYKVAMWLGDFEDSKDKLFPMLKGDNPTNVSKAVPTDERRNDAKSFLANVHLTKAKKQPSPEAHV